MTLECPHSVQGGRSSRDIRSSTCFAARGALEFWHEETSDGSGSDDPSRRPQMGSRSGELDLDCRNRHGRRTRRGPRLHGKPDQEVTTSLLASRRVRLTQAATYKAFRDRYRLSDRDRCGRRGTCRAHLRRKVVVPQAGIAPALAASEATVLSLTLPGRDPNIQR